MRLRTAILAPTDVDEEMVKSDRKCEFGVWLFGPGLQYCGSREYQNLKSVHKQLHKVAFEAFCNCRNGNSNSAEQSLSSGDFKRLSDQMAEALKSMRSLVEEKERLGPRGRLRSPAKRE